MFSEDSQMLPEMAIKRRKLGPREIIYGLRNKNALINNKKIDTDQYELTPQNQGGVS